MKKAIKATTTLLVLIGLLSVSCAITSCSPHTSARNASYNRTHKSHIVKRNYKIKGNLQNNKSTYRAY